ncbi:hypothetical protein KR018_002726, partial [Drosophila ironensis]
FAMVAWAAIAFAAPGRSAPYAPAGWQPRIPFSLPNEYLPPFRSSAGVEITKQRVEELKPPSDGPEDPIPPSNQYGSPDPGFKIIYPDEEDSLNSTDPQPNIRQGRYFIVSEDNKLQRVSFSSQQSGDSEDFTAQLSYSTVGQLRDPVYRYNRQGQLERVLK